MSGDRTCCGGLTKVSRETGNEAETASLPRDTCAVLSARRSRQPRCTVHIALARAGSTVSSFLRFHGKLVHDPPCATAKECHPPGGSYEDSPREHIPSHHDASRETVSASSSAHAGIIRERPVRRGTTVDMPRISRKMRAPLKASIARPHTTHSTVLGLRWDGLRDRRLATRVFYMKQEHL